MAKYTQSVILNTINLDIDNRDIRFQINTIELNYNNNNKKSNIYIFKLNEKFHRHPSPLTPQLICNFKPSLN